MHEVASERYPKAKIVDFSKKSKFEELGEKF